ncbi:hypothetical protein L7F22_038741 [Adiantum nelumboides]|nr:hypothetical protein [Adiantum nelumboides]
MMHSFSLTNFISLELANKLEIQDFEMGDAKVDGAFIGNLTRFEYPKLARFCQTQEEFAEVHGLSQSAKLWKHLSAGDLPESEWLTVFDTPKYKGSKNFLNMVKPQFVDEYRLLFYRVYQEPPRNNEIYLKFATCFVYERCSVAKADPEAHKIAWAIFAENIILSLKHNPVAWKRKLDAFRDTHGPINVITKASHQDLDIQSNNKAKVLKNELKEKKAEFFNKRDALIHREPTASTTSMIQTKIMSLQTRCGTLKGANATAEQLAAVEVQITAMSNAKKLIEGDDKIADMKIAVESIERDVNLSKSKLSCSLYYMSFFENMMKQLANGCTFLLSPAFYAPEEDHMNRADFYSNCVACGGPLAAKNAIGVYMLPCDHKYHRWSNAEAAHHMSFATGPGYTENVVGVEERNVADLGIASPGGAKKSWSDRKAAKNVGHDTVPPESPILGATSKKGVEAVLSGDMDVECVFGGVCEEVQIKQVHSNNYCT